MSRSGAAKSVVWDPRFHERVGRPLTAIESVLVFGARVVCDFNPSSALVRIFEEVDVGALVKPVMPRFGPQADCRSSGRRRSFGERDAEPLDRATRVLGHRALTERLRSLPGRAAMSRL